MSALGLDPANLTGAFPSADAEAWRQIVDKALKGADFDRALTTRTRDGIVIRPLYPQTAEGQARPARAQPGPWTLAQRVDHPDAGAAADLAIADLQGGASGLVLVSPGGIGARGFGATPDDLETRLGGVMPDMIRIRLDAGHETPPLAEALSRLTRARGTDGGAVAVDFAYDPVAAHARHGDHEPDRAGFGAALARLAACGFAGTLVSGDGRIVHDAGGTTTQELAYVIAALVEALRAGEGAGLDVEAMASRALAIVSADADIFTTIAKMRAVRILWARVQDAASLPVRALRVEAETAWRMMSGCDPYVNLLRATAAVTGAGLGGADAVTVLPHTLALGLPDAFARRVARNIQNVLIGESNLHRVADPAGGSGYIEALTRQLAEAAWKLFQQIEAEGGAIAAVCSGAFPARVAVARAALEADVATRKQPLTGVSEFPDLGEAVPEVVMPAPEQTIGGVMSAMRVSAPFEALRQKADAAAQRPAAFLAAIGAVPDYNARATFTANALAAGGIAALSGEGGTDVQAIARAAAESGSALAVICSSDALYGEYAGALARALKDAGIAEVWLAGRGGENEAELRDAGVSRFLHARCDIIEALNAAHAVLVHQGRA